MFLLLRDNGGFCYEAFGALVKALNNTAFYWLIDSYHPQEGGVSLEMIFDDGSEHGGISSGEESELDRKLENPSEESR